MSYTIRKKSREITGELTLTGSKSISNRALIIRALCPEDFPIHQLAAARDTELLTELLQSKEEVRDAGPAGTTFRFLTAYLSTQPGSQVLTGTERMKQRPIGVLVEALRQLGANIEYLEKEGFPPLRLGPAENLGQKPELTIAASTSSQYISALLMIAPSLPQGLALTLEGKVVSRPYIEMTLQLMAYFGISHEWEGPTIRIAPQAYQARPFRVEADWSAASYYYAMVAMADKGSLQINGLFKDSLQGDAVLARMMESFGLETAFNAQGVRISKTEKALPPAFEWNFLRCPDLAQTLAVLCAGLGVHGLFTGLDTLKIKETDRIEALKTELAKVQSFLSSLPERFAPQSGTQYYMVEGKARIEEVPTFATYEDHRMAMAFAPLALAGEIRIEDPMVVVKSYPEFWNDLEKLGFEIGRK